MGLIALGTLTPPVTLDELRAHLRLDYDADEDAAVLPYLLAATEFVEEQTRTAMVARQYKLTLDAFPQAPTIKLPRPPFLSLQSVKYLDPAGQEQTLDPASLVADIANKPGRLVLKPGHAWPATAPQANAVSITFTAGYASAEAVPALLKAAVKLYAGHLYENREAATDRRIDTVPLAVESIISLHAFPEVVA